MKYFYSHVLEIESLIYELDKMDLSKDEKYHLAQLIDANIHNHVLDIVLSELSEEDKIIFLKHLNADQHDKAWQHIQEKIEKIEEKIINAVEDLKKTLHKDIKMSQKLKRLQS
ncbi:hypothetical protein HYW46_04930 [Candidatus Daviesbacteria bacterium]|nr:hypothetical protein [Candidatus Daviesbacteria bacterium]